MIIAQAATQNSDFLKLIESLAPYVFGGIGGGFGIFIKFITDREKRKIIESEKRLKNADTVESIARNQREALNDIYGICLTVEDLGNTFETSQLTAKQFAFLIETINRIRDKAEDVLDDGLYTNRFKRRTK